MRFLIFAVIFGSQLASSVTEASVADRILRRKLLRSLQYIEYSIAMDSNDGRRTPIIVVS